MTTILPQCFLCVHFDREAPKGTFRCTAFPEAIPDPILFNEHDHREPYEGDHGVRFEPDEEKGGE